MAEQSSTVATLRALVMLLCVILIPVAAICGTSFPNVIKAIQSGRMPTLADFHTETSPATARSDAPPFRGSSLGATTNSSGAPQPVAFMPGFGVSTEAARSPVVQLSYNAPVATSTSSTSFPQSEPSRYAEFRDLAPGREPEKLQPTSHSSLPPSSAVLASEAMSPDAQFKHVQERLKQLGATYYVLEPLGDSMQEYRFYCRMAIGGDAHVVRPFECIDNDSLHAMTKVLEEVEAWRKRGG